MMKIINRRPKGKKAGRFLRVLFLGFSLILAFFFSPMGSLAFSDCPTLYTKIQSDFKANSETKVSGIEAEALKVFSEAIDPADIKLAETMTASFRQRFKAVLRDAQDYLKKNRVKNAAVVLDLDETVLDNRAYFIIHKRYDATLWNQWMERGEAPVLPEALNFIQWLQAEGFRVYFVSGRQERFRQVTVENLNRIGIKYFDGLYMKPNVYDRQSARHFKIDARADIENKGHPVLIILGDQESDLKGGHGVGFKLPNPIYFIP